MQLKKFFAITMSILTIGISHVSAMNIRSNIRSKSAKNLLELNNDGNSVTIFKDREPLILELPVHLEQDTGTLLDDNKTPVACLVCLEPINSNSEFVFCDREKIFSSYKNAEDTKKKFFKSINHAVHRQCAEKYYKKKSTCPYCNKITKELCHGIINNISNQYPAPLFYTFRLKNPNDIKYLKVLNSEFNQLIPGNCSKCKKAIGKNESFAFYGCSKVLFDLSSHRRIKKINYKELVNHAVCLSCLSENLKKTAPNDKENYDKTVEFKCPICPNNKPYATLMYLKNPSDALALKALNSQISERFGKKG